MKRLFLSLLLLLSLSSLSGLYAEVILTDEEAAELDETIDTLGMVLQEQQTTISDLKNLNEEQQTLLNEQETKINELNSSLRKQKIYSVMRSILIAISSLGIGVLIGLLI